MNLIVASPGKKALRRLSQELALILPGELLRLEGARPRRSHDAALPRCKGFTLQAIHVASDSCCSGNQFLNYRKVA